jgi:hypothetical protein
MELNLEGRKPEELGELQRCTRYMEPDHLRSRPAYELGIALTIEIMRRWEAAKQVLEEHGQNTGRIGRASSL